jgi:antitoxin HigA-1
MKPLNVSINALSRHINVQPNRISEIVNGKRPISADTALHQGKYFNVSPEIWLNLQSDYDIRLVGRTTWQQIEPLILVHAS